MIKATLMDHMGSDVTVVNAARVSFGKKSDNTYTTDKDEKLIWYLAEHKHMSPFGHCFASFHVKAPIFVARQLVKHEYMPWNEISRRYVDEEPEFYQPDVWRGRSADKKQGSSDKRIKVDSGFLDNFNQNVGWWYEHLLEQGVAPEQARMVLPQSMMTEWYWSGTLYAFAKMCGLRLKEDTQAETRIVAEKIEDVMMKLYPVSWEALRMYEE